MLEKNVLIVGGTFDNNGGKPSGLIQKIFDIASQRNDVMITLYNGGAVNILKDNIIEKCKDFDIVFWTPNVPNTEEKVRNVKEINPRTILISSKRNDNNKYTFAELISRALEMKSNLTIEFSKLEEKKFNMMVFDPLGNQYYKGTNIDKMVNALFNRAIKLTQFTRCPTTKVESANVPEVPDEAEFFGFARSCSDIFHNLINPSKGTKRFLGNMSFRCQNGFPSFRGDNGLIFVSKRNVDKSEICKESFVPAYLDENDNVMYYGNNKPSVDTPIQLRLYKLFPEFNYMIHAHCYFKAPYNIAGYCAYTYNPIPCGAIEEVDEIYNIVRNELDETDCFDKETDMVAVNLIGHGCILMAKTAQSFLRLMENKNNYFIKRPMPENTFDKFKKDCLSNFRPQEGKPKLTFKNTNNLSLKDFKEKLYHSSDKKVCMVEDSYCCHGSMFNCWCEPVETGAWFMKRKEVNKALADTYKEALSKYPERIFTAKQSGKAYIAIITRDINGKDIRIFL